MVRGAKCSRRRGCLEPRDKFSHAILKVVLQYVYKKLKLQTSWLENFIKLMFLLSVLLSFLHIVWGAYLEWPERGRKNAPLVWFPSIHLPSWRAQFYFRFRFSKASGGNQVSTDGRHVGRVHHCHGDHTPEHLWDVWHGSQVGTFLFFPPFFSNFYLKDFI